MTPYYQDDWLTVYHGDCKAVMADMAPESVHCVITSPPFWGLRDYGTAGQLGLERTPEEYVANLVAVFREVKRVLRADGTVWLNLGDSYAAGGGSGPQRLDELGVRLGTGGGHSGRAPQRLDELGVRLGTGGGHSGRAPSAGLAQKQLVGIPWRVAFALQADGWYLRSDIIWAKPNPMPESVTDRPTKSHEYIFLLSKSPRYYFDADAVREPDAGTDHWRGVVEPIPSAVPNSGAHHGIRTVDGRNGTGRNIRSVWTMATQPYPGAHFATFPEALPERCIKAGTSEKGVCPECGAPWERVLDGPTEVEPLAERDAGRVRQPGNAPIKSGQFGYSHKEAVGWRPSCGHVDQEWTPDGYEPSPLVPVPATCLDPFAGSGTTGLVAARLSRRAVLIDLSLDYLGQLMDRNADIPLGLTS